MTKEKSMNYKKAYVELNEIFKVLAKEQRDKIPEVFIDNVRNNMDSDYEFEYDESKGIFEQNLMVETEALLVEIYERYLATEDEKEMWQKYDRFCLNKIEEEKRAKYSNNIFENNKYDKVIVNQSNDENIKDNIENNDKLFPMKYEKENLFQKFINFIKNLFNKK